MDNEMETGIIWGVVRAGMFWVMWAGMAAKNIVIIRDEDFGVMWPETAKPEPINMEKKKRRTRKQQSLTSHHRMLHGL